MNLQEYFNSMISNEQCSTILHKQHYCFAHQMMPYVVENHFQELVRKAIDETAQDWILHLWNQSNEFTQVPLADYSAFVHPEVSFVQLEADEIGVIFFTMPSPRISPEAIYSAVVFAFEEGYSPSQWLRCYFTLELSVDTAIAWTLGEWKNSKHLNLGKFKYEPTIKNFLTAIVTESQKRWRRR